jgi:hypothetical protein
MEKINEDIANIKIGFQNLNCDDFKRSLKMVVIEKYLSEATKNPLETKKSICARLNVTPAVLNKHMRECGLEKLIRKKKSSKDDSSKIKETKLIKRENKTRGGGNINGISELNKEAVEDAINSL